MFRRYLARGDSATKCASLRALMGLFVSQPRLMLLLEQDRLLATVLSEKDDLNLCLTALQSLRRILLVRTSNNNWIRGRQQYFRPRFLIYVLS
jgi:hypothetical protein